MVKEKPLFLHGLNILSNRLKKRKPIIFLYVIPLASIPITVSLVLEHRTKDPVLEPLYFWTGGGRNIYIYRL